MTNMFVTDTNNFVTATLTSGVEDKGVRGCYLLQEFKRGPFFRPRGSVRRDCPVKV